jgi:hypothetical protein
VALFIISSCISLHSEKHENIVFAEGSKEFTWLKNCGVSMTTKVNGKNVFDLHRLIGLYNPKQMLFNKIPIDDFIIKEKYKIGQSSTAEDVICTICMGNILDGEDVEKLPCNVRLLINEYFKEKRLF